MKIAHAGWRQGDDARRRIERAGRRPRHPRPGDPPEGRRRSTPIGDRPRCRADAAVTINGLVRWTINRGYAGARSVGRHAGHGGRRDLRQRALEEAPTSAIWSRACGWRRPDGTLLQAPADRMEFDYDYSRLKRTGEIVLWAAFRVTPGGDPAALRAVARESLAFQQAHAAARIAERRLHFHESRSGRATRCPDGIPPSAGALVDRAGLKGAASAARASRRRTPTSSSTTAQPRAADIRALDRAVPAARERSVRRHAAR